MFPAFACVNMRNLTLTQMKLNSQLALRNDPFQPSYLAYVLFCCFGVPVLNAFMEQSAFMRVLIIVGLVAFTQMVGIYASCIITRMKNVKFWPFTICDTERHYVSPDLMACDHNLAVAYLFGRLWPLIGSPSPAVTFWALAGRFIDLAPKALNMFVGEVGTDYIVSRHDLVSFTRKIVSRPVADVLTVRAGRLSL